MDLSGTSYSSHSRHLQEPPCTKITTSYKFFAFFVTVAAAALFFLFIFFSMYEGYSRHTVYLLQGCLAVALLEKSWWYYRIRHRFLTPLEALTAIRFGHGDPEILRRDPAEYNCELLERMEPKMFAVNCITERWMKDVRGAAVAIALVAASIIAAISTIIALHTDNTLATCAAVGSFAGVLSACLAPTRSDGVAILVHESALTVTGMNTMVAHYTELKLDMAIVDYLFVALASWAIIVILRIIVSKKMLECFLMITLDTVALLHVTIIMMEVLDFVEHPLANNLPFELAAFFVTIASAELGHYLFNMVTCQLMHCLLWRHMSLRLSVVSDFIVSAIFGAVGMIIWMLVGHTDMSTWNIIALLGAVGLSQLGRSFLSLIHETAMAPSWNLATFSVWNNGIMELMNPFLVGWIVFYPYAKAILEAESSRRK